MPPHRHSPTELIPGIPATTIGDFWSWAYFDVLSNANRGVFAEFIIEAALDIIDTPRLEWDAVDLRYRDRLIEIKSSAYLQTWEQEGRLSKIVFGIAKTRGWDARTNTSSATPSREAHVYVFCLYPEKDGARANVLDVSTWEFYVLPTSMIEREFREQKTVTLGPIQRLVSPVNYDRVRTAIDDLIHREQTPA